MNARNQNLVLFRIFQNKGRKFKKEFRIFPFFALFIMSLVFAMTSRADSNLPSHIEVIYDNHNRITGMQWIKDQGIQLSLYNLNAPDSLLTQFDQGLPNDLEQAKKAILNRFQNIGHEKLKQQFMTAYQGVIKSTEYGLDRYPAIIFDQGKAVVYGITDLKSALLKYQHWHKKP